MRKLQREFIPIEKSLRNRNSSGGVSSAAGSLRGGGAIKNNCTPRDGKGRKSARARAKREKDFESIRVSGVFKLPQWRNLLLVGLRN